MTYVAFIRAVNVAGHARVRMEQVCTAFTVAGCDHVRSYLQSGNILFECSRRECAAAVERARRRLGRLMGEEPALAVRSIDDIDRVIARSPFRDAVADPRIKRYVVFLMQKPKRRPALPVISGKQRLEAVAMTDREVFVVSQLIPNRRFFGFPNEFVEAAFGVPATSRNWSTVVRLASQR
jgi:uncharacterized protein (DUF1697 family)